MHYCLSRIYSSGGYNNGNRIPNSAVAKQMDDGAYCATDHRNRGIICSTG